MTTDYIERSRQEWTEAMSAAPDLVAIRDEYFTLVKLDYAIIPNCTKRQFAQILYQTAGNMGIKYGDDKVRLLCLELAQLAAQKANGT